MQKLLSTAANVDIILGTSIPDLRMFFISHKNYLVWN